jgi:Fur family ferric uptake transcriptional regulator
MESTMHSVRAREPITAEAIMAAFNDAGLRNTRPRQVIAQHLAEHAAKRTDFATDEFWKELQQIEPQLGRATLFRAVDVLVDLGILDRIELGNGARRYRVCTAGHHHHLICTRCHRIEEVEVCLPERKLAQAAAHVGWDVERHALELYGRCAACQAAGT